MSVKDTIILDPKDLKYLLIDSLRLYSDNVVFLDGTNPYRFSIRIMGKHPEGIFRCGHIKDVQDDIGAVVDYIPAGETLFHVVGFIDLGSTVYVSEDGFVVIDVIFRLGAPAA